MRKYELKMNKIDPHFLEVDAVTYLAEKASMSQSTHALWILSYYLSDTQLLRASEKFLLQHNMKKSASVVTPGVFLQ